MKYIVFITIAFSSMQGNVCMIKMMKNCIGTSILIMFITVSVQVRAKEIKLDDGDKLLSRLLKKQTQEMKENHAILSSLLTYQSMNSKNPFLFM